jgi:hypothetical protein
MKYPTVSALCEGVAGAIREKEGSTALVNPQDFVDRIKGLEVGGASLADSVSRGVFIQHKDGHSLYTVDTWKALGWESQYANGIAVVLDGVGFVIAKTGLGVLPWSSDASNLVNGILTTTSSAEAKRDFAGAANTALMLATDTSGAAYACNNYTFPSGAKGYLPSLGELDIVCRLSASINAAMSVLGGDIVGIHWSSTQGESTKAWAMYLGTTMATTYLEEKGDTQSIKVLPFTTLEL